MNLKHIIRQVIHIAKDTGNFLREQRKTFNKSAILEKGHYDYVSYVDKIAEKQIIQQLSGLLPEAGFISEEGEGAYQNEEYCWMIDPLDGTTNFIHDYPPYCVSIALQNKDEVLLGVVYEVCRDECFWAWKNGGAYLNEEKIATSTIISINQAFVGLGLPYQFDKYSPFLQKLFSRLYGSTAGIRISGSAAVNLCYVAAGRFDLWFEGFIKPWDFAAGALIVSESGGTVSGLNGNVHFLSGHHLIASANPTLHDDCLRLFCAYNKEIAGICQDTGNGSFIL